jgi:hypothetical protein
VAGAVNNLFNSTNSRPTGIPQDQADVQNSENSDDGFVQSSTGLNVLAEEATEDNSENGIPSPQPSEEPGDPTSTGDIDYNAGLAGDDTGAGVNSEPQLIAQDDS